MGGSPPATVSGRWCWSTRRLGRAGKAPARRWWGRVAGRVRAEAGAEVFSELVAHRAETITDVPRGRCWRALRRLHQEPQHQVEDDADADSRRDQGEDDEDDAHQQRVDTEVRGEARTDAPNDAVRST